jgi:hypothetical protein
MCVRPHATTAATAGCNLRQALRAALDLGCAVTPVRRTDEVSVSHPSVAYKVRVKSNRKDAPRALTTLLRKLAVAGGGAPPNNEHV